MEVLKVPRGRHQCARGTQGVAVTNPPPGQTEVSLAIETLKIVRQIQVVCRKINIKKCPMDCPIEILKEQCGSVIANRPSADIYNSSEL